MKELWIPVISKTSKNPWFSCKNTRKEPAVIKAVIFVFPKHFENRGVYDILYLWTSCEVLFDCFFFFFFFFFFWVNLIHFSSISCSCSFILVLHIFTYIIIYFIFFFNFILQYLKKFKLVAFACHVFSLFFKIKIILM